MNALREYTIKIANLEEKVYTHSFKADNSFFKAFEQDLIEKGDFETNLSIEKTGSMLRLKFKIVGSVGLTCDRSLEEFDEYFDLDEQLIIKFGDHYEELSDEIILLPKDQAEFNIAQHLYDYIALTIPIKKLHPRFRDDEDQDETEGHVVYSTADKEDETDSSADELFDPRWEALRKLNKN